MTPEQKIRNQLTNELKSILPKGRYLLQSVETNTVGVPDFYLAYNSRSLWIEVKDLTYQLDRFQLNWATTHARTGCSTILLTSIQAHHAAQHNIPLPAQPPNNKSTLYSVPYSSNILEYSTLGRYIEKERPVLTGLSVVLSNHFTQRV